MTSALKKLTKKRPTIEQINTAMDELSNEGTRGAIIVASALIEDILRGAILVCMVSLNQEEQDLLFNGTAPLSSFSAKIRLAYALGIVGPETRSDLDRLRELRNACAHAQVPVTFETDEIKTAINNFKWLDQVSNREKLSTHDLFVATARILMIHLTTRLANDDLGAPEVLCIPR